MDFRVGFSVFLLASQPIFANNTLRYIVKFKSPPQSLAMQTTVHTLKGAPHLQNFQRLANGAYSLVLNTNSHFVMNDRVQILQQLQSDPSVEYAVVDKVGYFRIPEETGLQDAGQRKHYRQFQWNHFQRPAGIMLESNEGLQDGAFSYLAQLNKKPIVVAVLDTGITLNASLVSRFLKDSEGRYWGWNFASNNNNLMDETRSFHGSHVAGIIAANGRVIQGVGENLKILPLKIPNHKGMFYESAVINAMYWAVGAPIDGVPKNIYPAKVLNMSFGIDTAPEEELKNCDPALQEAVDFVHQHDAVLVASAGNDNNAELFNAPAICKGVIRVASTGPEGLRSYFSNYGKKVTMAAPGGDKTYGRKGGILSTVNPGGGYQQSGFDFYQGTSMASPHVAAVAALIFSVAPYAISAKDVKQLLITTTHNFGQSDDANKSCLGQKSCGHGILDAEYAIKATLAHYDKVFSAPATIAANLMKVEDENGVWQRQGETFSLTAGQFLKNPRIHQEANGAIIASYGNINYQFYPSAYQFCEVIGFDGVGCYF